MPVFFLSDSPQFPSARLAGEKGLLAVGGDLSEKRLLTAYRCGIFPWFSAGEPLLWWSPDPRLVLFPSELKVSTSLAKVLKREKFHVTMDEAFDQVIVSCACVRRKGGPGTWIVPEMIDAYRRLHESGFAHSVESWYEGKLAGGLYGVSLGRCFFGESMFARVSNASKVAFVRLVRHLDSQSFQLIDCQITTEHLIRFGAKNVSRDRFLTLLELALREPTIRGRWRFSSLE